MATLWVQVLDFCGYVRGQCTLALIGVHCTASPPLSSALLPHQITPVHSASFTVGGSDGGGVPIGDGVDTVPRYWCSPSPHHQRIAPPPRLTLSLALSNSVALEDEAQSYDRDELNALVRSTSPPYPCFRNSLICFSVGPLFLKLHTFFGGANLIEIVCGAELRCG
jgi:hypothetical protein